MKFCFIFSTINDVLFHLQFYVIYSLFVHLFLSCFNMFVYFHFFNYDQILSDLITKKGACLGIM